MSACLVVSVFFFLKSRRPPRSTQSRSSAASDVYKRQKYVDVPQVDGIPLVADMSSMICSEPVDVSKYGVIYFGVQKNIAPAGMAVALSLIHI